MGEAGKVMKSDTEGIDNSEVSAGGAEGEQSYISLPYLLYCNHGLDLRCRHLPHCPGYRTPRGNQREPFPARPPRAPPQQRAGVKRTTVTDTR